MKDKKGQGWNLKTVFTHGYRYIIYASLVFVAYKLARADYLKVPTIYSPWLLVLSWVVLIVANFMVAYLWFRMLVVVNNRVKYLHALASLGANIFGKYIPGFVWTVVGSISYIYEKYEVPRGKLLVVSIYFQALTVWCAFVLGCIGIFMLQEGQPNFFNWVTFIITAGITLVLLVSMLSTGPLDKLAARFLKSKIEFSFARNFIKIIPLFFLINVIWCCAFYLFASSIYAGNLPLKSGLGFNLGIAYGIISIFTPGGVGVREGVLTKFLINMGLDTTSAVSISVSSRLWFFCSEVLFFIQGVTAYWLANKKANTK